MSTMRRRPLLTVAVASAALAAALAGCTGPAAVPDPTPTVSDTPTPTPTPTAEARAPGLDELMLTPDGMGTLVIGQAPSEEPLLRMLELDPAACSDERTGFEAGIEPGDPQAARWVPIAIYQTEGFAPWSVDVADGVLWRIDLFDGSIPTDSGVRIGDSADAALAAYPDAMVSEQWATDVVVVPGTHGVLHIEIAREPEESDLANYWGELIDTVVYIRAVDLHGGVFTVAASDNIAGGCL